MATRSTPERATSRKKGAARTTRGGDTAAKPATAKSGSEPKRSAAAAKAAERASSAKSTAKPATKRRGASDGVAPKSRAKKAAAGPGDVLARLRAACLALPETAEKEAWQTPTFRVRGKMFAMFADDHHGDGRVAVWCKAPLGAQEALVESDPEHFFRPPYVGPSGWIGVRLDRGLDWSEIADILREGWRVAAPKKLVAALDEDA